MQNMLRCPPRLRTLVLCLRQPGLARRAMAAVLALWVFGALQLLALPAGALGTCAMVCSLDGSGCCCRLGMGGTTSPTGEHRFFGRPWAEQWERTCPEAVVTVVPWLLTEPDHEPTTDTIPPETGVRHDSLVEDGESPGDTRRLEPPRPPPTLLVLQITKSAAT